MTGGIGRSALTAFYRNHFIFNNPEDTALELISRTVGVDRVIDEFNFSFTHDKVIDWLYVIPLSRSTLSFYLTLSTQTLTSTVSPASHQQIKKSASLSPLSSMCVATAYITNTSPGTRRQSCDSWACYQNICHFPTHFLTGECLQKGRDLSIVSRWQEWRRRRN
jgi:hypothetical protein